MHTNNNDVEAVMYLERLCGSPWGLRLGKMTFARAIMKTV